MNRLLAMVVSLAVLGWRGAVAALGAMAVAHLARGAGRSTRLTAGGPHADAAALVVLTGLHGGLSPAEALEEAGFVLGEPVAAEVRSILRAASLHGMPAALTGHDGVLTPVAVILARSAVTGAAAAPALAGFLEARRSERLAQGLTEARTLPVRLVAPLSLLVLPGVVALVMGPALADQLAWLVSGVLP